jgi:hypothetical protein
MNITPAERDNITAHIEEGRRILKLTGNTDHYPVRYVITGIRAERNHKTGCYTWTSGGLRTMSGAAQGRNTYPTQEAAEDAIRLFQQNTLKTRWTRAWVRTWKFGQCNATLATSTHALPCSQTNTDQRKPNHEKRSIQQVQHSRVP